MASMRSRIGAWVLQKPMKYRPTVPSWNAYGVDRRTISPRLGVLSSAVVPSRSSTWDRCDVGTCVGSLVESSLVRPNVFSWSSSDSPLK